MLYFIISTVLLVGTNMKFFLCLQQAGCPILLVVSFSGAQCEISVNWFTVENLIYI